MQQVVDKDKVTCFADGDEDVDTDIEKDKDKFID